MHIVHVNVRVKPEYIEDFINATKKNAAKSLTEPGIVRFDVIQRTDDPAGFVLVESYLTDEDPAVHKETMHYKDWREEVESMMSEPRQSTKYKLIYPENME